MHGIFPVGTTGEGPTHRGPDEIEAIVGSDRKRGRRPRAGLRRHRGNATKVVKTLKRLERYAFPGSSRSPYYNRPTQDGLREHFTRIAEATDRQVMILQHPVPHRRQPRQRHALQGRASNIVGVKDSSGDPSQSLDLLRRRPKNFTV